MDSMQDKIYRFLNKFNEDEKQILIRKINNVEVHYLIEFDGINYSIQKSIKYEDFTEVFKERKNLVITMAIKLILE